MASSRTIASAAIHRLETGRFSKAIVVRNVGRSTEQSKSGLIASVAGGKVATVDAGNLVFFHMAWIMHDPVNAGLRDRFSWGEDFGHGD